MDQPGTRMHLALLRAEVAAARIEALTLAEPETGRLWRTEAAFAEAVRSVALEDVRLSESEIVMRLAMNRTEEIDARGAELAGQILDVLRAPGDVLGDPVAAIRRIERAAAPIGVAPDTTERLGDAELQALATGLGDWLEMPVAAGLRAAADYARRSGRRSPAAERLVFMAVESAARAQLAGQGRAPLRDGDLLAPVAAHWVVTPSVALTRRGFRLWSPLREAGVADLLALAAESLAWDLGQLGRLRRDVARIRAAGQGRHGRSRMAEMARFVLARPIFTSALVADELGVTRRTALNLIAELEGQSLIRNLLPRRAARFWATTSLADRLRVRPAPRAACPPVPSRDGDGPEAVAAENFSPETLTELDRAVAEADRILAGLKAR
ncbi:helix-turn-helix domain-containing protein [Roseitranquillus sediminis]|uniref:helix-turn-helix domain-containing protein n=1 Tax=Roseitranquillus sediminis TaxID=2809051 RepID=UPI001D0C84EF|nr:helix-turn-helix domain-containing protein [Roseitranquillus sediminis]MBM9595076.1 hypothetical protein [Roseitranquillus sediminis]